jgi:bacillopeptidase F
MVTTAPAPPDTPVQHTVSLAWQPSTNPNVVSYSMYRSTISGASFGLLASAIGEAAYVDQTVQSGTRYFYVVTAVDDQGRESSNSGQVVVTVP